MSVMPAESTACTIPMDDSTTTEGTDEAMTGDPASELAPSQEEDSSPEENSEQDLNTRFVCPTTSLHMDKEFESNLYNLSEGDFEVSDSTSEISEELKSDDASSSPKNKEKQMFECEFCKNKFPYRSTLAQHRLVHTGERPFKCGMCDKAFSCRNSLTRHFRLHTGEKPYVCDLCHKGFTRKSCMLTHRRIHTGERPYCCGVCDKTFLQSAHLGQHMRIHTGDKPFGCPECGETFSQSFLLQRHRRIHNGFLSKRQRKAAQMYLQASMADSDDVIYNIETSFQE